MATIDQIQIPNGTTYDISTRLEKSATNSFDDGVDSYFKKVVSTIVPVQAGSGIPSPTNVRAIIGFTECTVANSGKNICDTSGTDTSNGYVNGRFIKSTGIIESSTYAGFISEYTPIFSNKTYTMSGHVGSGPAICFYDKDKNYLDGIQYSNRSVITFTTPVNTAYYRASIANSHVNTIQIELGSTATSYEPYTANTATISFGEASTVYGGRIDLISGKLTATYADVDLGSLDWVYASSDKYFHAPISGMKLGNTTPVRLNVLCSHFMTPSSIPLLWSDVENYSCLKVYNQRRIAIKDTDYTDAVAFKAAVNGVQLIYDLEIPIEYQLTPAQLRSLVGANRLTSSTGEVTEIEYITNKTIAYVDNKVESITDNDSTFVFTLDDVPQSALTTYNTDLTQYSSATVTEIKAAVDAGKFVFCKVFIANLGGYYALNPSTGTTMDAYKVLVLSQYATNNRAFIIMVDFNSNKISSMMWDTNTITTVLTSTNDATQLTLGANNKYKLKVGDSQFVFTTPPDTTYESKTAASGGTDVSLVTTGEKHIWNNKLGSSDIFTQDSTLTVAHTYYYNASDGYLDIVLDYSDIGDTSRLWIIMYTDDDSAVSFETSVPLVEDTTSGTYATSSSLWVPAWDSIYTTLMTNNKRQVSVDFNYIYTLNSYIRHTISSSNPLSTLKDYYDDMGGYFYIYLTK